MIYHLTFDCLPIPRERLDDLDIPLGIQAMAQTDKQTDTETDIAIHRLNQSSDRLIENFHDNCLYSNKLPPLLRWEEWKEDRIRASTFRAAMTCGKPIIYTVLYILSNFKANVSVKKTEFSCVADLLKAIHPDLMKSVWASSI